VLRKGHFLAISIVTISFMTVFSISAEESLIPAWIKTTASFWVNDQLSDEEFISALQYLVEKGILEIPSADEKEKVIETVIEKPPAPTPKPTEPTTAPKTISSIGYSKLYELLPSKGDLSSEWTVGKSLEYNKATKAFYYENAGQTRYDKDVNFIDEFRMNVYIFSDSKTAAEEYEQKYRALIDIIGYWGYEKGSTTYDKDTYTIMDSQGKVIVNEKNCVIINDTGNNEDKILGWCVIDNYLIFLKMEGFYPEMDEDAINFMNIARQKVISKT